MLKETYQTIKFNFELWNFYIVSEDFFGYCQELAISYFRLEKSPIYSYMYNFGKK